MEVKAHIKVGKVRRLGPLLLALVISGMAGAAFPFIQGVFSPTLSIGGAFLGCVLTLVLASFETFFYARRLAKLDIKWAILAKSAVYASAITVCYLILHFALGASGLGDGHQLSYGAVFSFALAVSLVISSFVSISRILGQNELVRLVFGSYHTPREEQRVVMFLDLEGSTAIAEKIGPIAFLKLLNDFLYDITTPILDSGGEIYKYLGDGVIVTWKLKAGLKKSNCLMSFFVMQQQLQAQSERYLRKYQLVPQFRAGIHVGPVVIGEMGDFKREIAILGDTVNTAARIISECSAREKRVLISDDLMQMLPKERLSSLFRFEGLGGIQLKGKRSEVSLVSVDPRAVDHEEHGSLVKWSFSIARPKMPALLARVAGRFRFGKKAKPAPESKKAA